MRLFALDRKIRIGRFVLDEANPSRRFDGGGGTDSEPMYSAREMRMFNTAADYIRARIGQPATPYSGETRAAAPQEFFDAISKFQDTSGQTYDAVRSMLQGSSNPSFIYDPKESAAYWQDAFATPAMQTWNSAVAPEIRETLGTGGIFNTRSADVIADKAGQFYNQNLLAPLFSAQMTERQMGFQAGETAAQRGLTSAAMLAELPTMELRDQIGAAQLIQQEAQAVLADKFARFQRMTEEASPWINMALQYRTGATPSMENIARQGTDWLSAGIQGASTLGAASILASDIRLKDIVESPALNYWMQDTGYSDEKLKDSVEPSAVSALTAVRALNPVTYRFKGSSDLRLGFVAQEVEKIIPNAIVTDEHGFKMIDSLAICAVIVKALQEIMES